VGATEISRTELTPSETDDQVDPTTERRRWRWRLIGFQLPAVALYAVAALEAGSVSAYAAHGAAFVAAACGQVLSWRANDDEQRRSAQLAAALARAETQAEERASIGELFVHLARRNQSLLDRQIGLLVQMEEQEADPDALDRLFRLDHLATRIRRNAESLLVLSGEDPPRRWGRPVALADVVRAAVSEVEDYRRTEVAIDDGVGVVGRAVADLAHLVAELVENGLQFSPPETRVRIANLRRPDGGCELRIEDRGIGMAAADRDAGNDLLASPPEVDLRVVKRLGFHVVSRLAVRYGVRVRLLETPGGGMTAVVLVPESLLAEADSGAPAAVPSTDRLGARRPRSPGDRAGRVHADRDQAIASAGAGPRRHRRFAPAATGPAGHQRLDAAPLDRHGGHPPAAGGGRGSAAPGAPTQPPPRPRSRRSRRAATGGAGPVPGGRARHAVALPDQPDPSAPGRRRRRRPRGVMTAATVEAGRLNWTINAFVGQVPGTIAALVVSSDGLALAMSDRLDRARADQLAAITAGLSSLTRGAARALEAGDVRQLIVELDHAYLFVTSVSDGSCFAVVARADCDLGLVGYEMGMLVERIGQVLTPALRTALQAVLPR